jgi:hypothetical protein
MTIELCKERVLRIECAGIARERMLLADTLLTVGLIREADSYASLTEAAGVEVEANPGTGAYY